jgi:hypothetical protein
MARAVGDGKCWLMDRASLQVDVFWKNVPWTMEGTNGGSGRPRGSRLPWTRTLHLLQDSMTALSRYLRYVRYVRYVRYAFMPSPRDPICVPVWAAFLSPMGKSIDLGKKLD